ncbi:MAG: hypothetical protein ACK4E7_11935 [Permianibacter sp.]
MKPATRIMLLLCGVGLSACVSAPPSTTAPTPATRSSTSTMPFTGPGHDRRNAVHFPGISNPLAFSQKQQEWLWLHYRDWQKLSQSLREYAGARYDEVTLLSKDGEQRVIYFRMPNAAKP